MDLMKNKGAYQLLKNQIGELLSKGREQAGLAVNTILVQTYWHIGKHIIEFEQHGKEKSDYGSELLDRLSRDLTLTYGKGFSRSNLFQIRRFYSTFPKIQTLSGQLSWSHYSEILKAEDQLEISFYVKQCEKELWSVRELKRQMKSMLFHRLALSKDKKAVLAIAEQGVDIQKAEDIIKDPYVFEFLGIPQRHNNPEGEVEAKLIDNPPIGIVLGAYKDQVLVEYATENITNQLFVSKYQLFLPDKKILADELEKSLTDSSDEVISH